MPAIVALLVLLHGPFEPAPRDRSFALAPAPGGVLLVWSEIDPGARSAVLHTALLDFDATLIGQIHTIQPTRANVHATRPAIATNGDTFFIAWVERDRFGQTELAVGGTIADSTGKPLVATRELGLPVTGAPAVVWNGVDYRLFGSANYAITPSGDVRIVNFGDASRRVPFATPDANGWIDWTTEGPRATPFPFPFPCSFGCPTGPVTPASYTLDWTVVSHQWIRTGQLRDTGYRAAAPIVDAEGDDLLIVWSTPTGLKATRVSDAETTRSFALPDSRAADSTLVMSGGLVVFDYVGDIYGTHIRGDTFGPIFPISTGPEWDSVPRVQIVGEQRYAVAWIRDAEGPDVQLISTIVTP